MTLLDRIKNLYNSTTTTHRYIFCMLMIPQYCLYFPIQQINFNAAFIIHAIGLFMTISMTAFTWWNQELIKKIMPVYWYITIIFCLPFTTLYMLFHNDCQLIWLINAISSMAVLLLFVDFINLGLILAIAAIAAYVTSEATISDHSPKHLIGDAAYSLVTIASLLLSRKALQLRNIELRSAVKSITHEVKTPIAAVSMLAATISTILHNSQVTKHKTTKKITIQLDNNDWEMLQSSVKNIEHSSKAGIRTIETILHSYKEECLDIGRHSLADCIKSIITNTRHFTTQEMQKLEFKHKPGKDIIFYGSKMAMEYVIVNLITMTFKNYSTSAKIELLIDGLHLFFHNNGSKISSRKVVGSSITIYYCKLIMQFLGGDIVYETAANGYSSFILTFPDHDC